ncbi:Serine/threonine-protein kinase [Venturia nashicola]|uniref:Serine/threonine-protein kinase n=1 Tax=Venturia nashicola TaxID=86259 RepID=A0A4Z1PK35_9PEZI|nr:Serine/threonine-protein kinase [Venturia nashicola]
MSSHQPHEDSDAESDEAVMLDPNEAEEEIEDDGDVAMDSDDEDMQEILLQNDSSAHFDAHKDSIFCIAQHPTKPAIVATGGGDDVAYIFDSTPSPGPLLPKSWETTPQPAERKTLETIAKLEGHTDSVNGIIFTQPKGEFVATAGLDGQLRVWHNKNMDGVSWEFLASAQEVQEINWIVACPSPSHTNTLALGALDGSVWVYEINAADKASPLTIVQSYYLHTAPCTAGTWTRDGKLLATVSEDSSLYVWDVWGDAAADDLLKTPGTQYVVGLTGEDVRFGVEGGLFSVAASPSGGSVAVGGAEGNIRVIGLPRFNTAATAVSARAGTRNKTSSKQTGGVGQAGQILASLQAQSDSVETIAFSDAPLTLMAVGSVDGSIVLFDAAHNFAKRRKIESAHEDEAVIKVEFVKPGPNGANGWILTSCGNDGVVRRWDVRGGTAAANGGLKDEWKGHRGDGEGGGVLGFVQGGGGGRIVTAGDDGISLVFNTPTDS